MHAYLINGAKPISVGRSTRVIPPHTRRTVLDRDTTCRYPACNRKRLEIHHLAHWEHGGPTDTHNLAGFCGFHHHRKHDGAYDVTGNADQPNGLTFTRPDGSTIRPGLEPIMPVGPLPSPPTGHRYNHPTGERLQDKWVHFNTPRKVA